MAVDTKQYLEELLKEAGVSDDNVKQAVSNFFGNEKVAKRLGDDILRQQDYSRNMDSLKAEQKRTSDYYQSLVTWEAEEKARWDAEHARNGNGNGNGNGATGEYLTKKDLEAIDKKYQDEMNRREGLQIALLKDGMRLASQHVHEFHEPLDTDALEKIAVDKKLTLRAAYEDMVSGRRAEAQQSAFAAKLAAAREEGARDFASKHKIPVDTVAREHHVMFDRDLSKQVSTDYVPNSGAKTPQMERGLRDNFIEAWDTATTAKTSAT